MFLTVGAGSDILQLKRHLTNLDAGIQKRVLVRSVREAANHTRTVSKRSIIDTGGFKSGYVNKRLTASGVQVRDGVVNARVRATTDRWSLITQFSPRYQRRKGKKGPFRQAGSTVVSAQPWRQSREYKKVFLIQSKQGGLIPVLREGKKLRGVYGAAVARELARALDGGYGGTDIMASSGEYLQRRVGHHLMQIANMKNSNYRI